MPAPARPAGPDLRTRWRKYWRRKPFHRLMVVTHRWPALVLGLLLVVETTAGAVLLYRPELHRLEHLELFVSTPGTQISAMEAVDAVHRVDPDFEAWGAQREQGVWQVADTDWHHAYYVDPGTGRVNGSAELEGGGWLAFLVNLHDCAFSCEGYPGYQAWTVLPVWTGGPGPLGTFTWAQVVLGGLGLLLVLLVLTSLRIWWPGIKRLKSRFVVRTGKGRFARDYDLHNVVGALSLPFLLMWGVTGAAWEIPAVHTVWLTITGGDPSTAEEEWGLEPHDVPAGTPPITADQAVTTALADLPGEVNGVYLPTDDSPYWEIDVITGYRSYAGVGHADAYVLVDPHDADHFVTLYSGRGEPLANRFYDKVFEPAHFGQQVNGWWRTIWFAMGIAPLVLMVTGISTWLFRRGTKRRRASARRPVVARPGVGARA